MKNSNLWKYENILHMQNYSEKTITAYITALDKWLEVSNFEEDLESFGIKFNKVFGSLSNATQRLKLSIIKNFYRFLIDTSELKINRAVFQWKIRKEKRIEMPLENKEVVLLFAKLEFDLEKEQRPKFKKTISSNFLIINILLESGMRVDELQQVNDFNLLINYKKARILGKGKKERIVFWTNQTQKLAKQLKETRIEHPFNSYNSIYKNLRKYGEKMGLELHPHKLRHTFATNWINKGGSAESLSAALGHESLETTSIYVKQNFAKIELEHKKIIGGENAK